MGNWFAEKLGPPPVARFQPGQPWPPQVPQQYVQPAQYAPQHPLTGHPQPQYAPLPPPDMTGVQINDVGSLLAAAPYWKGTAEEKANTAECPKCGGPLQMYTGMNAPKIMNRDGVICRPMERCHYCGYNGHFEQLGQQATDSGIPMRVI
jgi:hypothetical protein